MMITIRTSTFGRSIPVVQALSSQYEMRASNCEQSVKIGGEGYFNVTKMIGRGPPKKMNGLP